MQTLQTWFKQHFIQVILATFFVVSAWLASAIIAADQALIANAREATPGSVKNFNGSDRNANIKGIQSPHELPRDPSNFIDDTRYKLQDTVDNVKETLNPSGNTAPTASRLKEFAQQRTDSIDNPREGVEYAVDNLKNAVTPKHGASAKGRVKEFSKDTQNESEGTGNDFKNIIENTLDKLTGND